MKDVPHSLLDGFDQCSLLAQGFFFVFEHLIIAEIKGKSVKNRKLDFSGDFGSFIIENPINHFWIYGQKPPIPIFSSIESFSLDKFRSLKLISILQKKCKHGRKMCNFFLSLFYHFLVSKSHYFYQI